MIQLVLFAYLFAPRVGIVSSTYVSIGLFVYFFCNNAFRRYVISSVRTIVPYFYILSAILLYCIVGETKSGLLVSSSLALLLRSIFEIHVGSLLLSLLVIYLLEKRHPQSQLTFQHVTRLIHQVLSAQSLFVVVSLASPRLKGLFLKLSANVSTEYDFVSNNRGFGLADEFLFSQPSLVCFLALFLLISLSDRAYSSKLLLRHLFVIVSYIAIVSLNARTPVIVSVVLILSLISTTFFSLRFSRLVPLVELIFLLSLVPFVASILPATMTERYFTAFLDIWNWMQGNTQIYSSAGVSAVNILLHAVTNALPTNLFFGDWIPFDRLTTQFLSVDPGYVRQANYGGLLLILLYLSLCLLMARMIYTASLRFPRIPDSPFTAFPVMLGSTSILAYILILNVKGDLFPFSSVLKGLAFVVFTTHFFQQRSSIKVS